MREATPLNLAEIPDEALARLIADAAAGRPLAPDLHPLADPVHVRLRRRGAALSARWTTATDLVRLVVDAVAEAARRDADGVQLDLTYAWRPVAPGRFGTVFADSARGRLGLEITWGDHRLRRAPSDTIARNRSLSRERELFLREHGLDADRFAADGGTLFAFAARQFLIDRTAAPPAAVALFRGGRIVPPAAVDRATLDALIDGMAGWMMANLREDGHLTYKYWPSRGTESRADNTVRRLLATVALGRAGRALGRPDLVAGAARNLAFNLARFYREVDGVGAIDWQGTVKLGAVAMAALAIRESPAADRYAGPLAALDACIDRLWQPDGSFRTFLMPPGRNDNQNVYPGEALLYWATRLAERPDPALLDRALRTAKHYRDRHRAAPNPAFVPWHAQANALLARLTGRADLKAFVLEMSDWLLALQQWGPPLAPDLWGRFYDPERPDFGPPHASSTGVYVEGLAEALAVAQADGDGPRARAYARAIWRAVRSLRQLQYRDAVEAFYVARRTRVDGAIRTEVYDNEIRVDNVQHALMGLLKARDLLHPPFDQATLDDDAT